jgi:hypothetical protein
MKTVVARHCACEVTSTSCKAISRYKMSFQDRTSSHSVILKSRYELLIGLEPAPHSVILKPRYEAKDLPKTWYAGHGAH